MNAKQSFRWAGYYFLLSTVAAIIGLVLVGAGAVFGLLTAYHQISGGTGYAAVLSSTAPGFLLAILGVLVWRFGVAWAYYKTMTGAVEEQIADRFDSEKVKSEILAVIDDRLSEMQYEVSRTRKAVDDLDSGEVADEFKFEG